MFRWQRDAWRRVGNGRLWTCLGSSAKFHTNLKSKGASLNHMYFKMLQSYFFQVHVIEQVVDIYIYIYISNCLRPTRHRALLCFRARVREAKINVWVHVNTHLTLTCDRPMQSGFVDSIEELLKVHMYWVNVQGLRVKALVVCWLLFVVCCCVVVHKLERQLEHTWANISKTQTTNCLFVRSFVCLFACLFACLLVCLFVCLFVC